MQRLYAALSSLGQGLIVGALMALGMPGPGLTPLMPAGQIAIAFLAARCSSWGNAAALGLGYGLASFSLSTIGGIDWGTRVPIALTVIGTVLYGLPQVLWVYGASRRLRGFALFAGTIAFWALVTDAGDLAGFPAKAEALGAVSSIPWILGGARLVGTSVVSGIMIAGAVGTGVALAEAVKHRRYTFGLAVPGLAAMSMLSGLTLLARATAPVAERSLTVGVPQLNVDNTYYKARQLLPDVANAIDDGLSKQLGELGDVNMVALTETYDGRFSLLLPELRERWQSYARLHDQAVLLTSYLVAPGGGGFNAVGAISPSGEIAGIHRKVELAPFGETHLAAGADYRALPALPDVRVGVLVCQEAMLPKGPRALTLDGANLLVTTTDDSSFRSSILVFAHLGEAQLRAIETGRSMIWASNAGPSGLMTRWGAFESLAPFRDARAIRMSAEVYSDLTPFTRLWWLWPLLCVVLLVAVLAGASEKPEALAVERAPGALASSALVLAAIAFAAGIVVSSPAFIEMRLGRQERASWAIRDLFQEHPITLGTDPFRRFKTDSDASASGALAYFLDYYGLARSTSGITFASAPDWPAIEALLAREHVPTGRLHLDPAKLPRTATLVRFRSGEYGVLTSGIGGVSVFSPAKGGAQNMTPGEVPGVLEADGLIPNDEPH
jgi:apolipoprotein N-acyltransferase